MAAKDVATGKEQHIVISGASGLNKADVDRLVKDAEAHAQEDQKRREEIDARNAEEARAYAEKNAATAQSNDAVPGSEQRGLATSRMAREWMQRKGCPRLETCRPETVERAEEE